MADKLQLLTKEQVLSLCSFTEENFNKFLYEHHIHLPVIKENGVEKYDSRDIEKIMKSRLGISKTNTLKEIINETISKDNINTQVDNIDDEIDFEQLIKLKESCPNSVYITIVEQMGGFDLYNNIKDMPITLKGGPNPMSLNETRRLLGGITKYAVLKLVELQLIQYTYVVTGKHNFLKFETEEIKAKADLIKQFLELTLKFKQAKKNFNSSELQDVLDIDPITYKRWIAKGLLVPTKKEPPLFSLSYVNNILKTKENIINKDYSLLNIDEVKTILGIDSRSLIETYITKGLLNVKSTVKVQNTNVLLFDRQQIEQVGYMGLGLMKKDCIDFICLTTNFIETELHIGASKFWRWVEFGIFDQPLTSQLGFKFYTKDYIETLKNSVYLAEDTITADEVKQLLGLTQGEWASIQYTKIYETLLKYKVGNHRYLYSRRDIELNKADIIQFIETRRVKRESPTVSYSRVCSLLNISLATLQELLEKYNISSITDTTGCIRITCTDFEIISKSVKEQKKKQQEEGKNQYDNYITCKEQAEKWGISQGQVLKYCRDGKIPGAIKINGCWKIPKDAEGLKPSMLSQNNMCSVRQKAEEWGVSVCQVQRYCHQGRIEGAYQVNGRYWAIPKDSTKPLLNEQPLIIPEGLCSVKQKAKEWNISEGVICEYCRDGRIENAQKIDNIWCIPINSIKPVNLSLMTKLADPTNMCFANQKAKEWGLTVKRVQKYCREGRIEGAYKEHGIWYIPENSVKPNIVKPLEQVVKEPVDIPENMCFAKQKAKEWGVSVKHVQKCCRNGKVEGAYKFRDNWIIPKDSPKPTNKVVQVANIDSKDIEITRNTENTENIDNTENTEIVRNIAENITFVSKSEHKNRPVTPKRNNNNNSSLQHKVKTNKGKKPLLFLKKMVKDLRKSLNKKK